MNDETARDMSAELTTLRFVAEVLLANLMAGLSQEAQTAFMSDLLRVGSKTDHLTAPNEEIAELQADIAVRSQERLRRLIVRAAERAQVDTRRVPGLDHR